jgi:tetratricopeptide (TPR) repeat protein
MNQHLERAILLAQQSRFDLAENELRQALVIEPGQAHAHALLALCLAQREKFDEATAEATQAIHLDPNFSFAYYAHARVLFERNRFAEALTAINEAIRIDSDNADYFSLLASIHFQESRWAEALAAAENGLRFDPEHVNCTNQRAMALVKLGRKAEAGVTIDTALARNPENSLTHANQGWTLLEKGDPQKAAEHFREALRLDPQNEWARHGIIEALKARNIIYALMLKYFLWMAKFSRRGQWGIILGGYIGNRLLAAWANSNPALAPWILPVQALYVGFALMTWLAYPLFNLLLRLNRFGRLVLSREQTVASNWFGLCLLLALVGVAGWLIRGTESIWVLVALTFGLLLIPVSAVFRCVAGWPRRVMAGTTMALLLLGLGIMALYVIDGGVSQWAGEAIEVFVLGAVGSTWLSNVLAMQRPRR